MSLIQFKEFLSESTFNNGNGKYILVLLTKIKDGVPIKLGKHGETEDLIKFTKELKEIFEISKRDLRAAFNLVSTNGSAPYPDIFKGNTKSYKWTELNKGQFTGNTAKNFKIKYSGGDTRTGEIIQVCGLFMNLSKDSEFDYNGANHKRFLSLLKELNFQKSSDVIDKYMSGKTRFEQYAPELFNTLLASSMAGKTLGKQLKFKNAVHADIGEYYNLTQEKGLTNKSIKKDNTADCLVYTGTNFLKNLGDEKSKVDYTDYVIKITIDGKVVNSFIQISLKAGGRLGDISSFSSLSNNHKYFLYEGFSDWLSKAKRVFINISGKIKNTLSKAKKRLKKLSGAHNDIALDLFYSDALTEGKRRIPREVDIYDKYSNAKEYDKLRNLIISGLKTLEMKLNNMGDGIIYKIPNYSPPVSVPSASVLRFVYFNAVSILTIKEYLSGIERGDFSKVEVDMMYGNTIMPLVKVFADPSNELEFLPITFTKDNSGELPVFGLLMNVTTKNYLSFYVHLLSVTHIDHPTYINIQMRTKQDGQYVVDGQGFITKKQLDARYG